MKWRNNVEIDKSDGIWLRFGEKEKHLEKNDEYIFSLMDSGITDDDELIKKVSEHTDCDEISSGFRLAQFVEDYGDFLAEGVRSNVFGAMV